MSYELLNPPADLADVFASGDDLEKRIADDRGGDLVRQLYAYFKHAEQQCLELKLRTTEYEQRHFAELLHEAFAASSRMVLGAWEKKHERQFAL